ncbi:MAG: DUF3987 domain-containing protein [Bacteroidota bacterium]
MSYEQSKITLITPISAGQQNDEFVTLNLEDYVESFIDGAYDETVMKGRSVAKGSDEYIRLKKQTPSVLLTGLCAGRKKEDVKSFNGLVGFDVDESGDPEGDMNILVQNPHVVLVARSFGGRDLFCLVAVSESPRTEEQYKIAHKVAGQMLGVRFGSSQNNINRIRYATSDQDPYVNYNAIPIEIDYNSDEHKKQSRKCSAVAELIPYGEQHNTLVAAAGFMRGYGITPEAVRACLHVMNEEQLERPGPRENIDKIADAAAQWEVNPHVNIRDFARNVVIQAISGSAAEDYMLPENGGESDEVGRHLEEGESAISAIVQRTLPKKYEFKPFPVELLPAVARDYVTAYSKSLDCDPALLAVPFFPIAAAAIGNTTRIQLKSDWDEPCVLWTIIVSSSGTMKSPAIKAMLKPVNFLEAKRHEIFKAELENFSLLEKDEQKSQGRPVRSRVRVNDITIETMAFVHAQNPRSLLLARDEVAAWWASFNKYSKGEADLHTWIEFYEGNYVTIDRKSNEIPTLDIKSPCVSVLGGTQPDVLTKSMQPVYFQSGFEPRLLLAEPPENVPEWTEDEVAIEVKEKYNELIHQLYGIILEDQPRLVPLTAEAKEVFKAFVNESARTIARLPSGPQRSRVAKSKAVAARLALILQLCENQDSLEVTQDNVERAIEITRWFLYEAARIHFKHSFEKLTQTEEERRIFELPKVFDWKDVSRIWGVEKRQAHNIVNDLCERGYATKQKRGKFLKQYGALLHLVHFLKDDPSKNANFEGGESEVKLRLVKEPQPERSQITARAVGDGLQILGDEEVI